MQKTWVQKRGRPIEIEQARLDRLDTLVLRYGPHKDFAAGACALEAVAWLAGEKHSDSPECTCPAIAAFVRRFNDRLRTDDERTALIRPLIPALIGTRSTREVLIQRGYMAADWAVRTVLPMLCRALEWDAQASDLESLPVIVDRASALRARSVARAVRKYAAADAADADAAAAYAYAYADADAADAYADAADDADAYAYAYAYADADAADAYADADAAAYAAADAAAYAAADAYADAADAYADAAAADRRKRLAGVRDALNLSAVDLIRRLCEAS